MYSRMDASSRPCPIRSEPLSGLPLYGDTRTDYDAVGFLPRKAAFKVVSKTLSHYRITGV